MPDAVTDTPVHTSSSAGRRRVVIAEVALLVSAAGLLIFLVLVAQPWADAVGGCGGG
jgi:hypothetical protein